MKIRNNNSPYTHKWYSFLSRKALEGLDWTPGWGQLWFWAAVPSSERLLPEHCSRLGTLRHQGSHPLAAGALSQALFGPSGDSYTGIKGRGSVPLHWWSCYMWGQQLVGTFPPEQKKTAHENEEDTTWERERVLTLFTPELVYPVLPVVWFCKLGYSGPRVSLLASDGLDWVDVTHSQKRILTNINRKTVWKKKKTEK